jgi:RimJ/RimL family protein N-acetyltransferase
MSYFVRTAPPEHFGWLAMRTAAALSRACRGIEALDVHGRIRGMVCFDGWTRGGAFVHIAIDSPAVVRPLLHPVFEWAFGPAARQVLFGLIPETNTKSLRLATHLGFEVDHRVRDGWETGVDLVLMRMEKKDCRWLELAERKAA